MSDIMEDFAEYDEGTAVFGTSVSDVDDVGAMDYADEATADFRTAYRQGETAGDEFNKKIILYSVFSGLGVITVLVLIVVAAVFGARACIRACKKKTEEEDRESTGTAASTAAADDDSFYIPGGSSYRPQPEHNAGHHHASIYP